MVMIETVAAPAPTRAPTPAEIRKIKDPKARFEASRAAEPLMKHELSEIARDVVTDLNRSGWHPVAIAKHLGISRQRVNQLLDPAERAKTRVAALARRAGKLEGETARVRAALAKAGVVPETEFSSRSASTDADESAEPAAEDA